MLSKKDQEEFTEDWQKLIYKELAEKYKISLYHIEYYRKKLKLPRKIRSDVISPKNTNTNKTD